MAGGTSRGEKVELDTKALNEARLDGRMDTVMQETLERLQPEAAYSPPRMALDRATSSST